MARTTFTVNGIVADGSGGFVVMTKDGLHLHTQDPSWAYAVGKTLEADVEETADGRHELGALREVQGVPDSLSFRLLEALAIDIALLRRDMQVIRLDLQAVRRHFR